MPINLLDYDKMLNLSYFYVELSGGLVIRIPEMH